MQRKNPPLLKRVFIFEVLTFISNYGEPASRLVVRLLFVRLLVVLIKKDMKNGFLLCMINLIIYHIFVVCALLFI